MFSKQGENCSILELSRWTRQPDRSEEIDTETNTLLGTSQKKKKHSIGFGKKKIKEIKKAKKICGSGNFSESVG